MTEGEVRWDGEWCQRCAKPSYVGFSVPDEVWQRVAGRPGGILCIGCFTRKAERLGVVGWEDSIQFFPVSGLARPSITGWTSITDRLKERLDQRHAKGLAEYGQPIDDWDGDALNEAIDELLDLAVYLMRAHEQIRKGGTG